MRRLSRLTCAAAFTAALSTSLGTGPAAAQSLVPIGPLPEPSIAFEAAPPAGSTFSGISAAGVAGVQLAAAAPSAAPRPLARPNSTGSKTIAVAPPDSETLAQQFRLDGSAGWIVVDLDTGEVLDAHAPERAFVPASVAKLPTALFALDILGPEWRFETRLVGVGEVAGSRLKGDLYLQGGGDPELDTDGLLPLVTGLTQGGLREVTGQFFVDAAAAFESEAIDPLQPIDAPYNPALSGLCLNFNRVHVSWKPQSGADPLLSVEARAERLSPKVPSILVTLTQYASAPVFSHAVEGMREVWRIKASALGRRAGSRWLPVRRPAIYAGNVFAALASGYGLRLAEPRVAETPVMGQVLARHASRPLAYMLQDMLEFSTNLTAEMVGIAAARARGAVPRAPSESAAVMNAWAAQFAGFAPGDPGFALANHSGLSLESRVTPRRMADVLLAAARAHPVTGFEEPFLPGMIAGLLKHHHVGDEGVELPEGLVVRAKTGTMNFVRGLAGYIRTPGGRRLAFAYFANNLSQRGNGGPRGWLGRAKGLERALIRSWAARFDT